MKSSLSSDEIQGQALDEIKSFELNPAKQDFTAIAISSTMGGFIPTQADLVEKRASLFDLLFFLERITGLDSRADYALGLPRL